MYSGHSDPGPDVWVEAVSRRVGAAGGNSVFVTRCDLSDGTVVWENFTSVMKRAEVEAVVDGYEMRAYGQQQQQEQQQQWQQTAAITTVATTTTAAPKPSLEVTVTTTAATETPKATTRTPT